MNLKEYRTCSNGPIVIGIPGMVHVDENTRIDDLLKELNKTGINGVRMSFSGIEKRDDKITCNFNLNNYIEDISKTVEAVSRENQNIGVITSSISAGLFSYFISQNPAKVSTLVSISPALGWPYYTSQNIRNSLESNPRDFEITSLYDQKREIKRIVTREGLLEMIKTNGLEMLRKSYKPGLMKAMTLIGKEDKISDYHSMLEYHKLLGGESERLIEYDCGHNIYMELCTNTIKEFFRNTLHQKQEKEAA